jgi:hypothetical protein
MEVLDTIGKLLKIILPDKIENRKAEVHKQALDLSPGYSDLKVMGVSCSLRQRESRTISLSLKSGANDSYGTR